MYIVRLRVFDEQFVTALAAQIAARINPKIQRRNGASASRLLSVKDAAAYIGRTGAGAPARNRSFRRRLNDSFLMVLRKVDSAVVLDKAEADAIKPADASEHVLVD